MTNYDFRGAVSYALSSHDMDHVIEGVKRAVFEELTLLDPTVSIENTAYYNHTFIPDFILTWSELGRQATRQIFLRPSIVSTTAGHDIENLGHNSPVLLALKPSDNSNAERVVSRRIEQSPDVLVTDVNAVADIAVDSGSRQTSPLHSLVRSNLVRGGRGLIVSRTAKKITSSIKQLSDNIRELQEFTNIVGDVFTSDAAIRLRRAAQLLEMGITGNLSQLQSDTGEPAKAISGRLSSAEMRVLLPYLLKHEGITSDPAYWAHIGSMLTLELLEGMAEDLSDADLTPLVVPNLSRWTASRATASLYSDSPDEVRLKQIDHATLSHAPEVEVSDQTGRSPDELTELAANAERDDIDPLGWHFHARMLSIVVGNWRFHVTPNGRRLRGRDQSAPARWDEISKKLRRFKLAGVELNGLQRRVHISSELDLDVYRDVLTIRNSIDDDFQVPEVIIRPSDPENSGEITVSFTKMLATASTAVPASELVAIVIALLTGSAPVPDEEIRMSVWLPALESDTDSPTDS